MDEQLKQELTARFRDYLDREPQCLDEMDRGTDLFSLFTEFAGLRSEVRLESRQFKSALDDFRDAFNALDSSSRETAACVAQMQADRNDSGQTDMISVIMGLVELHDRLSDAITQEQEAGGPGILSFFCRTLVRKYRAHVEGQKMLMERVLDLMALCGVEPVEAVGKKFNPRLMKTVDFITDARRKDGTVCSQQRTGFLWNKQLLRPAEVIVAREQGRDNE